MRVVLLRPPRYLWPFNSENSAFWPPLGLLCLAAAVRRQLPEIQVEVWDAPGMRYGWRTLEDRLTAGHIDVLGVGEETASAHEALRAAQIVKRANPDCVVVAGGVHFAHAIEDTLAEPCVDVIVRGEGENTFVDLLRNIETQSAWPAVPGLAFRGSDGRPVVTPPRPLIADLDTLPRPSYDLIDLGRYGRGSRNHPALVSLEHSRGCVDSCSFCILWKHMGRSADGNGDVRPCYRTKSAARSFDEVAWLYRDFGRRTFGWVDPTFNGSPQWSDEWAGLMLASDLVGPRGQTKTLHTAWVRADGVVRDEKLGILSKLVRAGLRQVVIGLERDDAPALTTLHKHHQDAETSRQAVAILREKYPQVYVIGSVIIGLPEDTLADLKRLVRWQDTLGLDYCFFIPLTPNPGTAVADELRRAGLLAGCDYADYNFHTPVCTTRSLGLRDIESIYWRAMLRSSPERLMWAMNNLLCQRDARKRRLNWSLLKHGTRIAMESALRMIRSTKRRSVRSFSRKPSWYDS